MRIIIDLQGAQTASRFRGIGRYSLLFTQAIVRNRGTHDVILVLNGLFEETIEPIYAAFNGLLPKECFLVWDAPKQLIDPNMNNGNNSTHAEILYEAFLASLKPDFIHVTSLFEGYLDAAVTSINQFNKTIPVSVSFYDLIPLLNADKYFKHHANYKNFYCQKIEMLKQASLLLAISESTRQEGLQYLGLAENKIVNVSSAVDIQFRPLSLTKVQRQHLMKQFKLDRPFLLYVGDADERKNLPCLLEAYGSLPSKLRRTHCLVFVGKLSDGLVIKLKQLARNAKLEENECHFMGYVTNEELVKLYNLAKACVFPSWQEGFGLPILEAMSCGTPVICSNMPSSQEVVNNPAAYFDCTSPASLTLKIEKVLRDENLRKSLVEHGLLRAQDFSWDKSACRSIAAFEQYHYEHRVTQPHLSVRPRLAFISPLPDLYTGIAYYSAQLLPALAQYYDLELVTEQAIDTIDPKLRLNFNIHSPDWLRENTHKMDRVLYHFGNSIFHYYMFALLEEIPGVVVLHDFFLSGVLSHCETTGLSPEVWSKELYLSHGYMALKERYHAKNLNQLIMKYPSNLSVLQNALSIISHSEQSRALANHWYGDEAARHDYWSVIPLLRERVGNLDKTQARINLKLDEQAFVVASFGMLDPTKLNDSLLNAWLASDLASRENYFLIFVGENHGGKYGKKLLEIIHQHGMSERVLITGWVDTSTYEAYLTAADIAVQLRTLSRGETSAAVLDCLNYGLPTIVNAHGSMAELPDDVVSKLTNEFSQQDLTARLELLHTDKALMRQLAQSARQLIGTVHDPDLCALRYFESVEQAYCKQKMSLPALIQAEVDVSPTYLSTEKCIAISKNIAQIFPSRPSKPQLLLDISATHQHDLKTGIERVVRSLLLELLKIEGTYRVEPVYLCSDNGKWYYRYARTYTFELLDSTTELFSDEVVDVQAGDKVICLDLFTASVTEEVRPYLQLLRRNRVGVYFLVYDILPIIMPQAFPHGASDMFQAWLKLLLESDGAICISKAVADEFSAYIDQHDLYRGTEFKTSFFHLGADIESSAPSVGTNKKMGFMLQSLSKRPCFLMVGTIEPRKAHLQVLHAFEMLWDKNIDVHLIIVGKEGWQNLPSAHRSIIPEFVTRLRNHEKKGSRLFWFDHVSDDDLHHLYNQSSCLLATSEGEGFGLPLIEAARHGLPVIARDIPVFREVAGEHAFYFSGTDPELLANAIMHWLELWKQKLVPKSDKMPWLTWAQSARQFQEKIVEMS